ncbi:hypothetical protein H744_2c1094 [Photobacterium gaetbulicola Gung47]|uniref:Uncharacterized protein n=1 Tax=Photobacterium gaetbulicola Gung47 TaxID=658445 RepID=A0A0C5W8C7_9GAMM|nr:hypothetical protein H744_2c1094 [Photobacterium gaetbulicola Gung47]
MIGLRSQFQVLLQQAKFNTKQTNPNQAKQLSNQTRTNKLKKHAVAHTFKTGEILLLYKN